MISNRLKSIASLVEPTDIIMDVGCDHALLDIYLVKNKIISYAYVSDININALNGGIKNIHKYHLGDKITAILSDGIKSKPSDVNTLIISGMGTGTIIKILSNDKINGVNKLIIQSNNDYDILRKYLTKNGFYISFEEAIYDKDKYYINIVFKRGFRKYNSKDMIYGPILRYTKNPYYKYLLDNKLYILSMLPKYKVKEILELKKDINYLRKLY